ncbi:MAG: hypothetical protein R3B09_10670 [Nannocystaceae bacterium]
MSDITVYDVNPVGMTAVITGSSGNYTVTVEYNSSSFATMDDWFRTMPGSITINMSSTTVPSGYELGATGDGSWTSTSPSALVGTFVPATGGDESWSFTIVLLSEGLVVARHDPTFTAKKMSSGADE